MRTIQPAPRAHTMQKLTLALVLSGLAAVSPVRAQQASFVYRLGKDTLAVEQFTRSATRLNGELVSRQGTVIVRVQYDITLGADGYPTAMTYKQMQADGSPLPGRSKETRLTFGRDTVRREIVWPDSTQTQSVPATHAMVALGSPIYGGVELALAAFRKSGKDSLTLTTVGTAGARAGSLTFVKAGGDTVRLPGAGGYVVFLRADRDGKLQSVDGTLTTAKLLATRSPTPVDIAALAGKLKPTGVLSGRGTSRAGFATQQPGGVIMVDYGRPLVRERTVWGGVLVPVDTIWRLGANEATHFATSRELSFGDITVPAGLYTLYLFNAKSGPLLVVNKQVGVWGTVYDQKQDLVRIPLTMAAAQEFTEEFTINIRQSAANRGAIEIVWGQSTATAAFTVK